MRTDILLEVVDHLLPMLKILDSEKDGHGEGEETDQPENDLKSEALIKLDFCHQKMSGFPNTSHPVY